MRRVVIVALTVLVLAPAAASGLHVAFGAGTSPVSFSNVNVSARITGALIVQFHSDPATGCAVRGLCGYSGTIIWDPAGQASLDVMGTTTPTGTSYSADLTINEDTVVGNGGGTTDADTTDTGGASCADAAFTGADLPFVIQGSRARLTLTSASPSVLQTRCAGPLAGDLASALPSLTVPLSTLMRGRAQLSLRRDRSFAANGFAGTVSSTLSISLGRPGRRQVERQQAEPLHTLTLVYRAILAGRLTASVNGDVGEGLCGPLGACGARGTESLEPEAVGEADFEAMAGAKHPYTQLRQALRTGLAPRGVQIFGYLTWPGGGRITTNLHTPDGTCTDHSGLNGAEASAAVGRHGIALQFSVGDYTEAFRTRCPGPFAPEGTFANGHAPDSILGHATGTIPLAGTTAFSDDGYTGRIVSTLTITLSHRRTTRAGGILLTTVAN